MPDVIVIGGGIAGVSAAAFLAEAGAEVQLLERAEIGAGASGRNSGLIQHPLDAGLAPLHEQTMGIYRAMGLLAEPPAGLLMAGEDPAALDATAARLQAVFPELATERLGVTDLAAAEPELAQGLEGLLLSSTGWPIAPAAAVAAFAERARAAGAVLEQATPGRPWVQDGFLRGVHTPAGDRAAAAVVVACGAWTPEVLPGIGVRAVWGVTVQVALARPPRRPVEEVGADKLAHAPPEAIFSLVTAGPVTILGSTFLAAEPDPFDLVDAVVLRGARYVPALADATVVAVRACPRPQSASGIPQAGPTGVDGLFVLAGHGPWGMSTAPASAAQLTPQVLGRLGH